MSTMIPGIPPGGGGPPDLGPDTTAEPSITSAEGGGPLDQIRLAIMALQHFSEQTHDDQELAQVHKCITQLQSILAGHAKDREVALGTTPALRHVRRQSAGY